MRKKNSPDFAISKSRSRAWKYHWGFKRWEHYQEEGGWTEWVGLVAFQVAKPPESCKKSVMRDLWEESLPCKAAWAWFRIWRSRKGRRRRLDRGNRRRVGSIRLGGWRWKTLIFFCYLCRWDSSAWRREDWVNREVGEHGAVVLGGELLLLAVRSLAQLLAILLVLPVRSLQLEHLQDARGRMQPSVIVAPRLNLVKKLTCGFERWLIPEAGRAPLFLPRASWVWTLLRCSGPWQRPQCPWSGPRESWQSWGWKLPASRQPSRSSRASRSQESARWDEF